MNEDMALRQKFFLQEAFNFHFDYEFYVFKILEKENEEHCFHFSSVHVVEFHHLEEAKVTCLSFSSVRNVAFHQQL